MREQCENGRAAVFNIVVVSWVLQTSIVVSVSWNEKDTRIKHMGHSMSNQQKKVLTPSDFHEIWHRCVVH